MRQQENQRFERKRNFALRGTEFFATALRADICRAWVDMATRAKPDVVGLAAVVAVRRSSGRHSSAAETKLHRLLSKSENL